MKILIDYLKRLISLDLRALAFMRIGVAATIIADLIIRFSDLEAHYTDYGVLPMDALFRYLWNQHYFSFYTIANSLPLMGILFFINMLSAGFLMIGYRTRLFSVICWAFLLSLHNRNPLINQGGDDLLRLVLFLGIFLPWGYCYSLDAIKNSHAKIYSYSYFSMAGFAYMLQIICMYVFSALLKTSGEWTSDFTAIYYALSLDQILLPFGQVIFPYYNFLLVATFLVYHTELLLPFVLLSPFFNSFFRIVFFSIMTLMHIGIALSLNVGLFPYISIVCSLGILPPAVFQGLGKLRILQQVKNVFSLLPFPASVKAGHGFPKENLIQSNLMIFFSITILAINLETIGEFSFLPNTNYNWVVKTLRIDQHWAMFAPSVFKDDGWFMFIGKTEDNKEINIHESVKDNSISYHKPVYVAGTYKNDRWRKYSEGVLMISNNHFRPFYCSFLINSWNRDHPERKIKYLEIIYMKEISKANYEPIKPKREVLCNCSLMMR
jgi:hypothetical protein